MKSERERDISWHHTNVRWLALLLASLMQVGNYYCYDIPAVLEQQICEYFQITELQHNLQYTVYSLPNIVLPLIGGVLIDYLGMKKGILLFNSVLLIGQLVCVIGAYSKMFFLIVLGRAIYGLGGENMCVLQSAIVAHWFKDREIAFAMGRINTTFSRMGTILNSIITPQIFEQTRNLTPCYLVGLIVMGLSTGCALVMALLNEKSDKRDGLVLQDITDRVEWKDIRNLRTEFALICFSIFICQSNAYVFSQNNILMFQNMQFSEAIIFLANYMYQIQYYEGAILTPIFGLLVDKIGRRPFLLIVTGTLLLFINSWYAFMPSCLSVCFMTPLIGQIALGIFHSLYGAVTWPMIKLCTDNKIVGTAYGVSMAVEGLGLSIGPLVIGVILATDSDQKFRFMMIYFLVLSAFAEIDHIVLAIYDKLKLYSQLSSISNSQESDESTKLGFWKQRRQVSANDQTEMILSYDNML